MNLLQEYDFYENALFIKEINALLISDLHIGLEFEFKNVGIQIPLEEENLILDRMQKLLNKFKPESIIFNGDTLHSFSSLNYKIKNEFNTIKEFITDKIKNAVFIKGSHDTLLEKLISPKEFRKNFYRENNFLFTHGNLEIDIGPGIKTVFIGHEHPCVEINMEKTSCFLFKKEFINKSDLFILPAFNPLIEGVLINNQEFISPLLKNHSPSQFQPIITVDGEILIFPSINEIRQIEWHL